jgi:hypothetical protein
MEKVNSAAKQTFPKVFVNTEPISAVDNGGKIHVFQFSDG